MKKLLVLCIATMFLFAGCKKEDILWIEPNYEYTVTNILVKDPGNPGTVVDLLPILFPDAEQVTFTKFHPLGLGGDGEVKVYRTDYYATTYEEYGAVYDYESDCWYYDWYSYEVASSATSVNTYPFTWKKNAQPRMEIAFSKNVSIRNGSGNASFWELLKGDYRVSKESRKKGTLAAYEIAMASDDVEILLRR